MNNFQCLITHAGAAMIARAAESGVKLNLSQMAVGDGIQSPPDASATRLISEQYRAPLNTLKIAEDDSRVIVAEMVLPAAVGGFWTREVGLFAEDGTLVAVGNLPASYKPATEEGSGRVQTVRMSLIVSETQNIQLVVDPSVVMATVQYVDDAVNVALNAAADAMEEARRKVTFDEIYPIGDVKFFATFLDPNKHWPGTLWYYTGENKSIRIGKKDGSDVMKTGGSDTVDLTVDNMPKHNHGISGTVDSYDHGTKATAGFDHGTKDTSGFDHGSKGTNESGDHTHQGGMGGPGAAWDGDYIVGSDNDNHRTRNWTSSNGNHSHTVDIGAHSHTVDIGAHSHTVDIGSHTHTIELKMEDAGGGESVNIVESHIKLMCWYRAA